MFKVAKNLALRLGFERGLWHAPLPGEIKRQTIALAGRGAHVWIETGTYLGETTSFLAARFPKVISIEPSPTLFKKAADRFRADSGVKLLNGTSEEKFLEALDSAKDGKVAFWLDGHFSGGVTFQAHADTPVLFELEAIAQNLNQLEISAICIDDVRLFDSDPAYPRKRVLVDFAEAHNFHWEIVSDIFVMKPAD